MKKIHNITFNNSGPVWKLPLDGVAARSALSSMLMEAGMPKAAVELAVLDDFEMAVLNRDFTGLPGPTNVLSFPEESDPTDEERLLGYLAISADTVLREALLYGQNPQEHTVFLLAHGLAHLLGYDHSPEMDELVKKMADAVILNMSTR